MRPTRHGAPGAGLACSVPLAAGPLLRADAGRPPDPDPPSGRDAAHSLEGGRGAPRGPQWAQTPGRSNSPPYSPHWRPVLGGSASARRSRDGNHPRPSRRRQSEHDQPGGRRQLSDPWFLIGSDPSSPMPDGVSSARTSAWAIGRRGHGRTRRPHPCDDTPGRRVASMRGS